MQDVSPWLTKAHHSFLRAYFDRVDLMCLAFVGKFGARGILVQEEGIIQDGSFRLVTLAGTRTDPTEVPAHVKAVGPANYLLWKELTHLEPEDAVLVMQVSLTGCTTKVTRKCVHVRERIEQIYKQRKEAN